MKSVLCCFRSYLHQWCQQNQQGRTLTGILLQQQQQQQQPGQLGRTYREVPRCSVMGHLVGYTLPQDPAARNCSVLLGGKSLDTFGPQGPATAHKCPVPEVRNLWIKTIVNWEQRPTGCRLAQFMSPFPAPGSLPTGCPAGGGPYRRASNHRPGQGRPPRRKRDTNSG